MSKPKKYKVCTLIADSLKAQGVEYCFGIPGIPVIELAFAIQQVGIKFINFRNEQSASYAAAAVGYLTGRPAVVLTVTGPGVIHAVAGMANAKENCWPIIVLGGAPEEELTGMGSFQETRQLMYVNECCKYAQRVPSAQAVPRMIEQAVRISMAGRPGATYLDLPTELLQSLVIDGPSSVPQLPMAPGQALVHADPSSISDALALLRGAKAPLVIVGKGAAFARAEKECQEFVEAANLPFLSSPMGKGVIPDGHPQNVIPARSTALKEADVVLLVGARLNWILHFGAPPRYSPNCKFIKVDILEEEMHNGRPAAVSLVGHAKAVMQQLSNGLRASTFKYADDAPYWHKLRETVQKNVKVSADLAANTESPLNYYASITAIQKHLPKDVFIMSEGANTMDIGRTILDNHLPRSRLDAGTFGTMGVGLGQIIAACCVHPDRKVVAVMGDSAFGFSMAEYETVTRFNMNVLICILNNNGIGGGPDSWDPTWKEPFGAAKAPATAYSPDIRYENLCSAFGGKPYYIETYDQLMAALPGAVAHVGPAIMHIKIDPKAGRKKQEYAFGAPPPRKPPPAAKL